ncbi:hypothetical protein RG836_04630 [Pseudomonas sp. SZMC_28357]|uniref:hypothetical protein n=1 Tax=Pseudomonas sp. SZMC_28357 TaxID=3074380 RepID=UPI002871D372|nr:hypothetical protein [Pseudomonas sp. SZMC_28357]MDR9750721.1 hypothetical protein [Pseudomonas sp. SZMC_28357]
MTSKKVDSVQASVAELGLRSGSVIGKFRGDISYPHGGDYEASYLRGGCNPESDADFMYVHSDQEAPDDTGNTYNSTVMFHFKKPLSIARYDFSDEKVREHTTIIVDSQFGRRWQPKSGALLVTSIGLDSYKGRFNIYKEEREEGFAVTDGEFEFNFADEGDI